jgi:hypothetical protein
LSPDKPCLHPLSGTGETLVQTRPAVALLVFTATPGTTGHDKLQLLSAVGDRPAHG